MGVLKQGYVHVYTGNGKGKTTAALGLALRASGAGLKVYIQQFAKKGDYGEIKALRKIGNIKVSQCGNGPFIVGEPGIDDIRCAREGFENAKKNILTGKFDLVILDEINIVAKLGLVAVREMLDIIKSKPGNVELVLTGRSCPAIIKRAADIVTEMREIRHVYGQEVIARKGIEF